MSKDIIIHGDCLVEMQNIPDKSVDMVLCDLPYGVLNKGNKHAKWDSVIPFEPLWEQYKRIIKDNGAIVLFAQGMFTANLMASNPNMWRYNLVWEKQIPTGFLNSQRAPLRQHEDILVFYRKQPTYNPQLRQRSNSEQSFVGRKITRKHKNSCYGAMPNSVCHVIGDKKYPISVLSFRRRSIGEKSFHPTEKPVALLEYLIKTYSNEGDTVLDNTCGSGSTLVACVNTNRHYIGIEKEKEYYDIAVKRVEEAKSKSVV